MQEDKIKRLAFDMPISEMELRASVFQACYAEDQPAFLVVHPKFTVQWGADFLAEIEALRGAMQPAAVLANRLSATLALREAMRNGCQALQILYTYVRMLWRDDKTRLDAFGLPRYQKSRKSQGQLILLMKMALAEATANAALLAAEGYGQDKLNALQNATEALEDAKAAQLKVMGSLRAQTAQYYRLANAVWARMQALNEARSLAFPTDYAKWSQYALYPKGFYKKRKVEAEGVVQSGQGIKPESAQAELSFDITTPNPSLKRRGNLTGAGAGATIIYTFR